MFKWSFPEDIVINRDRGVFLVVMAEHSPLQALVGAMLSEELNSTGWQERLAACHMLPRLFGGINKVMDSNFWYYKFNRRCCLVY